LAALVLTALLVHSFWIPLDVLWFRALRKLEGYAPMIASIPESQPMIVGVLWNA
jgi:hypothetical protein